MTTCGRGTNGPPRTPDHEWVRGGPPREETVMATEADSKSSTTAGSSAAPASQQAQSSATHSPTPKRRARRDDEHRERVEVPGRPGVDARLDCRAPEDMEPLVTSTDPDAPKPQHVDGPDLAGQLEWTQSVMAKKS